QATSWPAATLPANQMLYATIWTEVNNVWQSSAVSFMAAPLTASIVTPANGAIGVDPAATIQWTNVPVAQKYYLYVGTTPGAKDLIDSAEICASGCPSP